MVCAPILLFVYNRPEHVKRTVDSLLQNELAAESILFIYSDAAKDEASQEGVEKVREYIHTLKGFKEITIIERNENHGVAKNIVEGVTTQINNYGKVIVVEDDLIVAPSFLRFMNDALTVYENEPTVGHIHGCQFFTDEPIGDTFLIKWTGSWGWATWQRSWKLFNPDGKALLQELKDKKLTGVFDFDNSYPYTRMLRYQTEGKNNSWAIRWNATLFLNNILSVNAGRSLVRNRGFDGSGVHCGDYELYDASLYMGKLPVEKITPTEENKEARKIIGKYYRRTNSFVSKARRRLKKEFSRIFPVR